MSIDSDRLLSKSIGKNFNVWYMLLVLAKIIQILTANNSLTNRWVRDNGIIWLLSTSLSKEN